LKRHRVPQLFEKIVQTVDKIEDIVQLIQTESLDVRRSIIVNDSYSERFALERRMPRIRILGPSELAHLGRERIA
jgi:hypothetical protein